MLIAPGSSVPLQPECDPVDTNGAQIEENEHGRRWCKQRPFTSGSAHSGPTHCCGRTVDCLWRGCIGWEFKLSDGGRICGDNGSSSGIWLLGLGIEFRRLRSME